jgi:uncharacterized protein YbjT (DUF2867 family)
VILVTAANGNQGRLLVPKLVAAGVDLRCCVRSTASADALREAGVTDVVVGDLSDPDVLAHALHGVQKVYYVGPALHPREREMGIAMIDGARGAGVQHFVFSSALHPIITDLIQHEIKRDIEEHLLSSGLEFTVLQPANFMLRHRLTAPLTDGVFRLSWALDRRQSMVDLDDVTDVVVTVLASSESHFGATYELVGPGRYTAYDIAQVLSAVLGREITAEQIGADVFLTAALGVENLDRHPYQARISNAISRRYSSHDFVGNPNVLGWLLGRAPTTFRQFVEREVKHVRHAPPRKDTN